MKDYLTPSRIFLATVLLALGMAGWSIGRNANAEGQQDKASSEKVSSKAQELMLKSSDDSDKPEDHLIGFVEFSQGRLLARVDDMLYMLNSKKEVLWETEVLGLIATPIVDSKESIYGIAVDHNLFTVDASTGEIEGFGIGYPVSGRAYYTQIKIYKGDQYLVVTNLEEYRKSSRPPELPLEDLLVACKGKEKLWEAKIPPNAEIQVWGDKIFAVSRKKEGVLIQEVNAPPNKSLKPTRN